MDSNQDKKEKPDFGVEFAIFTRDIIVTIVVVLIVVTFIGQPTTVDGSSMNPTLHDKDQLIIEKVSQRFSGFERYDIIVFPYAQDTSKYYIKRIIGLPGETIDIHDGYVFVDNVKMDDPYHNELMRSQGEQEYPLTIPEGYYFVLGDNRNHSSDSRLLDVGLIKGSDIVGKGFVRVFPFQDFGLIN